MFESTCVTKWKVSIVILVFFYSIIS